MVNIKEILAKSIEVDVTKFKDCMADYFVPPEAKAVEPRIPFSPMPGGALTANTVSKIIGIGKSMLGRPIELLEDVKYVLQRLAPHYRLIVATKGDLLDQERKMRKSSISDFFHHIEVMSDKKEQHYVQLLKHLDIAPEEFLMIGNSLKSDIIPPLELGAWGIYVPFHTTWAHEEVDEEPESSRYFQVKKLRDVLKVISH